MNLRAFAVATIAASLAATAVPGPAHAEDGSSWTSLYAGTVYEGSGWSTCPDPIRISVDTRGLDPDRKTKARNALKDAIAAWNKGKVVRFEYGGQIPVRFDGTTGVTTPEDGVARDRWIYLTVVNKGDGSKVDPNVVGLAGPLRVDPATKIILEGSAAFRAKYVNKATRAQIAELFAHEIGHIFGLGHSGSKKDVMYATLNGQTALGPGDIAGGRALLKPCPAPPQPDPIPPSDQPTP
jgi:hypothetical protein